MLSTLTCTAKAYETRADVSLRAIKALIRLVPETAMPVCEASCPAFGSIPVRPYPRRT